MARVLIPALFLASAGLIGAGLWLRANEAPLPEAPAQITSAPERPAETATPAAAEAPPPGMAIDPPAEAQAEARAEARAEAKPAAGAEAAPRPPRPPLVFGGASRRLILADGTLPARETSAPPGLTYFGARAVAATGESTVVTGFANLREAIAEAIQLCARRASGGCAIDWHILPVGFSGEESGTLNHAQALIWAQHLADGSAFAFSADGAAAHDPDPSTAIDRCEADRRRLGLPMRNTRQALACQLWEE